MVKFVFKARERVKLCLEKDILTQLQLTLSKSGKGILPLEPLVVKDTRELFQQNLKVLWLDPGESTLFRANLKRFQFANGEEWTPAEYSISAKFSLCEQTPTDYVDPAAPETLIESENTGWFMIMS